jgi:hypothetical protein
MAAHLAMNANLGKQWIGVACAAIMGYAASASLERSPQKNLLDQSTPRRAAPPQPEGESHGTALDGLEVILNHPDPAGRNLRLRRLWETIAPSDIPAALNLLQRRNDRSLVYLKLELLEHWATFDPTGALAWARGLSEANFRSEYYSVIAAWATNDPAAALAWARGLPRRERTPGLLQVARAMAAKSPDAALRLLGTDPDLKAMPAHLSVRAVFESIAGVDPRKAIEAALLFPEGTNRKEALKSIASVWTSSDPRAALSWIKELPAGPLRYDAMQPSLLAGAGGSGETGFR